MLIPHSKPTVGTAEASAMARAVKSGQLTGGARTAEFERKLAAFLRRGHAAATSSGTASLHLALLSLGVGRGDEVVLPTYTCDALLNAVLYCGARPVLADVDPEDGNLSPEALASVAGRRTRAAIVTHSLGRPARMKELLACGVPIVEDLATALGAEYRGRPVGSFGRVAVCSFYATKMITTGEGGGVLVDPAGADSALRELRDYNGRTEYRVRFNYKLTEAQAAMGVVQLRRLPAFLKRRAELAALYASALHPCGALELPTAPEGLRPSNYRFVIRVPGRDIERLREKLRARGVHCGRGVLMPLHRLLGKSAGGFPAAEKLWRESLSLPIYPLLTNGAAERVARAVLRCLG